MKESLLAYVKRVSELVEHVRSNEEATKQSLIVPLFTLLGYDITDPRECMPEYKADFGRERSSKPVDWAFLQSGRPVFFVEAKEVGKKLSGYDEQLADYFAKSPEAKLGILTNGVHWRFFTDLVNENVMDKEPFVKWDVLKDDPPPMDFLRLLQKSQYNSQLIRTFAERSRAQNLLVNELTRLLEPDAEFTKLAIERIETRNLTANVVESWKPIVANAINEWAKQRTLSSVLSHSNKEPPATSSNTDGNDRESRIETTKEELETFANIARIIGDRKIAFTDTVSYLKIHLPERHTWVVCRLYLGRKRPKIWVPLALDRVSVLLPGIEIVSPEQGWTSITLESTSEFERIGEVISVSWDEQRAAHPVNAESDAP